MSDQLAELSLARAAPGARLGSTAERLDRVRTTLDRLPQRTIGDLVTVAHHALDRGTPTLDLTQDFEGIFGQEVVAVVQLYERRGRPRVSDEHRADQPSVAHDQLVMLFVAAGGEVQRIVVVRNLGGESVRYRMKARATRWMRETLGEQARRTGVTIVRTRPEHAARVAQSLVGEAAVVRFGTGGRAAELVPCFGSNVAVASPNASNIEQKLRALEGSTRLSRFVIVPDSSAHCAVGKRTCAAREVSFSNYRSIEDLVHRAEIARVWGIDPEELPSKGKSAYELLDSLGPQGGIRALLVFIVIVTYRNSIVSYFDMSSACRPEKAST